MSITDELYRLGNSARRLNAGSDSLNEAIDRIDKLLGKLNVGLDYILPRPLAEHSSVDPNGKRVIELVYVGYLKVDRSYHLATRTTKVLESRLQLATQAPGTVVALLHAPRQLRFAAVDVLPELVAGLAAQVDEMVAAMKRRQETAESLLRNLEAIASDSSGSWTAAPDNAIPAAGSSASMQFDPSASQSGVAHEDSGRTQYYPGTESTQKTPISAIVPDSTPADRAAGGPRKTVPIGSGALRRMQQGKS